MDPVVGLRDSVLESALLPAFLVEPPGWTRLEPQSVSGDPTPGLEARVHDPLWLLGRQWQLGEFAGEDTGSPVTVEVTTQVLPVASFRPGDDPTTPGRPWEPGELLEPAVEREPTPARGPGLRQRAEAGAQLVFQLEDAGATAAVIDALLAACPLTLPWDDPADPDAVPLLALLQGRLPDAEHAATDLEAALATAPPGLAGWLHGSTPATQSAAADWLAWYREYVAPPANTVDGWSTGRLEYRFSLGLSNGADQVVLSAPECAGGRIDWWSVDHDDTVSAPTATTPLPPVQSRTATMLATPLRFAGMPASRYWEFEDGMVNLGALQVQPHDLARLAVAEFGLVYGNDWLVVPLDVPWGGMVVVQEVAYTTTFGERIVLPDADDHNRSGQFRVFETTNRSDGTTLPGLFVPPSAPQVVDGPALEEVMFVRDEMANMAWAVERVVLGPSGNVRDRRDELPPPTFTPGTESAADMDYRLANEPPNRWIPLLPVSDGYGTFVLRKGAVVRDGHPVLGLGVVLDGDRPLVLQDEEVPREGVRLRRMSAMARRADGSRVLWTTRRVDIGKGGGSSGLAFDSAVRRAPAPQ
ncbi:MAG: hypothetical protein M3Z50_13605 [Actinomycetota bacterium]|nr:hypothetical protein [Actinomycetota bacterium]